ncbi:MAG: Uma2 family endonuclease, partial [Cyanothece sp. SIO2G6]|nr:Uma2 family endonuclease [Cyanothece sp. SIO2G6]
MLPTLTTTEINVPPGGEVILRSQTWNDYEALMKTRRQQPSLKISYNASTQEIWIMSPLPKHANRSAVLADLVKALLRFSHLDWQDFDPLTLKKMQQRGLEPDHCFYITNYQAILGNERIDLAVDPPPDLAIEVDVTSFSSVADYEAIAIPELWIYRNQRLQIYQFDGKHYLDTNDSGI